ncbi:MAG: phosphotransferase, partial [Methylococcales bacterium]|nr:phosphotransferase [Methylococcales bacterium]
SDSWHCRIVPPLAETFERLDEFLKRPLIQRTLPLSEKETILAIWQDAEQFCNALTSLPQTLCHLDAFHGNLFHTTENTILIDWALAGRGAIGEELTAMVSLQLFYPGFPMAQANALDKVIFEGYVDGLRDAGWQGDSRLARLGYTCAMVLRGLAGVEQDIKRLLDENNFSELQRAYGDEKIEEVADRYAAVRRFRLIQMAEEARQLL